VSFIDESSFAVSGEEVGLAESFSCVVAEVVELLPLVVAQLILLLLLLLLADFAVGFSEADEDVEVSFDF
jgi:hypothetical protein